MAARRIKRGYVPYRPTKRQVLKRKYPFLALKEGEYIDPPYPMTERHRLRSAVRYWNKTHNGKLHISVTAAGLVVGWPKPEKS